MRPYCPNNSNYTFREICCAPPHLNGCCNCGCEDNFNHCYNHQHHDCAYDRANCNNNCNCGCNKPQKPCNYNKPECDKKEKPKQKEPYICLPIKKGNNCNCSPFLYVMIGYMIGSSCPFCEFEQEEKFDI